MISIGEKAFKNCELLDRADVYGNIGYQAFYNCSFMSVLEIHNAEEIGTSAFQDCTSLQNVVLPDTLKKIGKESFRGCSNLKGIVIPDSVTEVGYRAFYDCKQLKEAVIGEKVNTWGSDWGDCEPFAQNPSLASVTIRSGVQEIPQGAFRNCDSLTSIVFPEGMLTIGENAFEGCDQLAEVVFSDSITAIRRSAFDNCCMLAAYTLPAGLESIGSHAFRYTAPAEVVIPDHVQTIGYECFRECPNLTKVVLGESITKWGTDWGDNGAFKRCPLLATVEIMNGVNSIGPYAFEDCVSLTEIEVPSSSVSVGEGAFKNCKTLKQATVYRGEICESAFEGCVSLESITIRKVTSIGRNAFRNCTSLADAELPRTLLALGGSCFRGTALTSVVIPDSTTEIGPYAFQDCTSLRSVYIGNNINTWRLDWGSSGAFLNCTALEYVFFADDGTVIGNTCLEGCTSLKAVYIPRSILNIPDEILKRASPDVVIYGQAGSAAEDFAASMNLRFETGAFPFSFD